MQTKRAVGYTLIEMLIVVAIVTALTVVALPSYRNSVRKSRRTDAMATLTGLQLQQEKWRANNSSFTATLGNLATLDASQTLYYDFSVPSATATTFVLRATAKSSAKQNTDTQNGTSCAQLEVNQNGDRTPTDCWR